jgi:hypothetical protein
MIILTLLRKINTLSNQSSIMTIFCDELTRPELLRVHRKFGFISDSLMGISKWLT